MYENGPKVRQSCGWVSRLGWRVALFWVGWWWDWWDWWDLVTIDRVLVQVERWRVVPPNRTPVGLAVLIYWMW
jgi:hypothetical protein